MNDRDVDQLVRSALAAGEADAGPHPDPDALFDYHAGELARADADTIQGHLARCPACARAVLDFETFPHFDAPSDEDVPSAEEVEAGWADLQARVREAEAPAAADAGHPAPRASGAEVVPLSPRRAPRPAPSGRAWLPAAAALLAATTLGLGSYVVKLHRALGTVTGPQANPLVVALEPEDREVRDAAEASYGTVTVPPEAAWVVLVLGLVDTASPPAYRAELRAAGDATRVLWSTSDLIRDPHGALAVLLPRQLVPAGRYNLRLQRVESSTSSSEPPPQYWFDVVHQ